MIETDWCVFTGAPCSGKTTVLNALEKLGYRCIPELARVYIEEELARGQTLAQIRADESKFQDKIVGLKKQLESELPTNQTIFLDRAMPDSLSYFKILGLDSTEVIRLSKIFRYRHVFIFDLLPWKLDKVRNEDSQTAALLDKQLEADYRSLGYRPFRIPVLFVDDRVQLVLQEVQKPNQSDIS